MYHDSLRENQEIYFKERQTDRPQTDGVNRGSEQIHSITHLITSAQYTARRDGSIMVLSILIDNRYGLHTETIRYGLHTERTTLDENQKACALHKA